MKERSPHMSGQPLSQHCVSVTCKVDVARTVGCMYILMLGMLHRQPREWTLPRTYVCSHGHTLFATNRTASSPT